MQHPFTLKTAALLTTGLALTGCVSTWLASNDEPDPVVVPNDFVGEPLPSDRGSTETPALAGTDLNTTPAADSNEPAANPQPQQARPVDAMVGHINGEAVYADQIFDVNLIAQLESFGRRFDGEEFQNAAGGVIQDRLQGIIINKLILGEAELNLQETQRRGIEGRIQAEREELLRFYGQGSLARAKAKFLEQRGKELEQHLVDFREELIIGSYVRSKVLPKIVVNQRDVERFFADNIDKYQQPDTRVVRLIIAVNNAAAGQIQQGLGNGQTFEKLATDPALNQYNPDDAGSYQSGGAISGDQVIRYESVNSALLKLKSGEHAGPIQDDGKIFFVKVLELTLGEKISLPDAQIDIENKLRATQFEKHALRFRLDLLKRGSYSNPAEMGNKLLEIAFARYDR